MIDAFFFLSFYVGCVSLAHSTKLCMRCPAWLPQEKKEDLFPLHITTWQEGFNRSVLNM